MERFDLLHTIHKALRHAMITFNLQSGKTDFTNLDAVRALTASWNELGDNLGSHARHENEVIFPLLHDRAPGEPRHPYGWAEEVEGLRDDHARIERLETEIGDLLQQITQVPEPSKRRLLGRELHRSIQRYTAMCLLHFDDEERHFMPRVWALYDDEELAGTFERVMAMVSPKEREYGMAHMVEALDPLELEELRAQMPMAD
ncbi:MAG TPA: hemerythrin domain-containing protein [Streptosporangiaceae bacterium]|nr:hemerythrin domain-containing protein [Streptosporangiaceae bacterium]